MGTRHLRFAVIGLGHIAQSAVLPALDRDSPARLTALISDDETKRRVLARRYGVEAVFAERQLHQALRSGAFDALYIATPNHLHFAQARLALAAGIHVLCEKPMTCSLSEAERLVAAARTGPGKLMVGYRLHCDPFYVEAVRIARDGRIGEPRIFSSAFTMQVRSGNIRTRAAYCGGSVPDLGIYAINAARSVFGAEPVEIRAESVWGRDERSEEVDEATSAVLRFAGDRLAAITSSLGAALSCWFEVIGSAGSLRLDNAYAEEGEMTLTLRRGARETRRKTRIGDQFAAEITAFAEAVLAGREPPAGPEEGLRDVRVVEAIRRAASRSAPLSLPPLDPLPPPDPRRAKRTRPPRRRPSLVKTEDPSID